MTEQTKVLQQFKGDMAHEVGSMTDEQKDVVARRVSDELGFSYGSVQRWMRGDSAPHPTLMGGAILGIRQAKAHYNLP